MLKGRFAAPKCAMPNQSVGRPRLQAFPAHDHLSLLSVPGIGKRTLDRLQKAAVESVSELCDLYVEEHGRSKESLVKYLKVFLDSLHCLRALRFLCRKFAVCAL